jgi:hypothetical protein
MRNAFLDTPVAHPCVFTLSVPPTHTPRDAFQPAYMQTTRTTRDVVVCIHGSWVTDWQHKTLGNDHAHAANVGLQPMGPTEIA